MPKRRILSSVAIGTIPSFKCKTLWSGFAACSALRPNFSSSLQRAVLPVSSGTQWEELILCDFHLVLQKRTSLTAVRLCRVALWTLHLHLKSTQGSDSEIRCNWHNSNLSLQLCGRDLLLVRLSVPISPRHCKEPSAMFYLGQFYLGRFLFRPVLLRPISI